MNFRSVQVFRPLTTVQSTTGVKSRLKIKIKIIIIKATDSRITHSLSSNVRFSLRFVQSKHLVMATVYGEEICSSTGNCCGMPAKYTDTDK